MFRRLILLGCCIGLLSSCGVPLNDDPKDPYTAPETLEVEATSPANNATGFKVTDNLTITFNQGVDTSKTKVTTTDACTGALQLSKDGFTTCEPLVRSADTTRTLFTLDPSRSLTSKTSYQLKATTSTTAYGGATLSTEKVVSFTTEELCTSGCAWSNVTTSGLTNRESHASAVFQGNLYVLGGDTGSLTNAVLKSSNGASWSSVTPTAGWAARSGLAATVFQGKLWILGGLGSSLYNDVWSYDGASWKQERADGAANGFTGRDGHAVVAFDDKLWVLGGSTAGGYQRDVWSSGDGITWTLVTSSPSWNARANHSSVAFQNKLWLLGGEDSSQKYQDVWSSSDGITWTAATNSAAWPARSLQQLNVFESKLWLVSGNTGGSETYLTFWTSSDGASWTPGTDDNVNQNQAPVYGGGLLLLNNSLYLVGGNGLSSKVMKYGK